MLRLLPADVIQVERTLDRYRPDVTILRASQAIAAWEVVVTHACDDTKWAGLRTMNIPVIELNATHVLDAAHRPEWQRGEPPHMRVIGCPRGGICERCIARDEEVRRRPRDQCVVRCLVDIRYADGSRFTDVFIAVRSWDGTRWASAEIRSTRHRERLAQYGPEIAMDPEQLRTTAQRVYRAFRAPLLARPHVNRIERTLTVDEHESIVDGESIGDWWWDAERSRWVRCYNWVDLPDLLGFRKGTLARMYKDGKLLTHWVQRSRGEKREHMYDADTVDRIAAWVERKRRGSDQRLIQIGERLRQRER